MKNIFAISAIAATLVAPAFADITGSSNCTEGVLGTSTNGSTANIDANWSANTINIKWYNGDTQLTQTSCQYDTTIVLPTQPTKPGYTFNGWRLRTTPAAPNCSTIDSESTCNGTSGCRWAGVYTNLRCINIVPVETTSYTTCAEIIDADTCDSITYQGKSICVYYRNECMVNVGYSSPTELPAESWCRPDKNTYEYADCFWDSSDNTCMCVD